VHAVQRIMSMCKLVFSFLQKLAGAPPELALVVFHTHGPYSGMALCRPCT
jgi:hypothetical protein